MMMKVGANGESEVTGPAPKAGLTRMNGKRVEHAANNRSRLMKAPDEPNSCPIPTVRRSDFSCELLSGFGENSEHSLHNFETFRFPPKRVGEFQEVIGSRHA
jgi:hypothetical protein